jgi:hypothetical protein
MTCLCFSLTKESNLFSIISQILNKEIEKLQFSGVTTQNAAEEAGLKIDVMAPTKENPSMTMAIEKYIRANNK